MNGDEMTRRISKHVAALLATSALLAVAAGAASAATVYNNMPGKLPGNFASIGFEATSSSEFGGEIEAAGPQLRNPTVTVVMSSWACERGVWTWPSNGEACATAGGMTFSWPVTLNVYEVSGEEPGPLIFSRTQTFAMPYRPSASSKCTGANAGKWFQKGTCFNGKAFKITFPNLGIVLPPKSIISVAYNTSDYGAELQRPKPCNSEPRGCPYDSLNVAVHSKGDGPPTVGSNPAPDDAYVNSTWAEMYCESPGGLGKFALSDNCWTEEQPVMLVNRTKR
jgi:hypothetical protein